MQILSLHSTLKHAIAPSSQNCLPQCLKAVKTWKPVHVWMTGLPGWEKAGTFFQHCIRCFLAPFALPFGASMSALLQYNLVQFRDCSVNMTDSAKSKKTWSLISLSPDPNRSKTWRMLWALTGWLPKTLAGPESPSTFPRASDSCPSGFSGHGPLDGRKYRKFWNGMIRHDAQSLWFIHSTYNR